MTGTASWRLRLLPCVIVVVTVAGAFLPVLGFSFLNWDDGPVITDNANLAAPGVVRWAFTTTHMQHYQPLSWLLWAGVDRVFGPDPIAFHVTNLAAHVVATLLIFVAAQLLFAQALTGTVPFARNVAAVAAALVYGVHPLRVEVVAWVSAMPYTLALALAMASLIVWLRAAEARPPRSLVPALTLFVASMLARPVALGVPVAFVGVDMWRHGRTLSESVRRALPFGVAALAAGIAEALARAPALAEVPWLYRLQLAATAPFLYLWRTIVPTRLTPLDVLPLVPEASLPALVGAISALALVSAAAWHLRRRHPALAVAWVSYLALLAPAAGLFPSGLQASADRYAYLPGVVVALAVCGGCATWVGRQAWRLRTALASAAVAGAALVIVVETSLAPWADSVSLWTQAVDVDPTNDVALYNLGTALAAAGRPEEAEARYREALAVNPAHAEAQANLNRLEATRLEREGNEQAARGDLLAAVERYEQAVARDPGRTHAHAALGMALATLGRGAEARPHLEEARRQGDADAAVANALGVLLAQAGQTREARAVLESGLSIHRNDVALAMNLTQVLLSSEPAAGGDAALALRMATAVDEATGGRDPRIVETLAAALAANGRLEEARSANARAVQLARTQGDEELAVQIAARGRAYRNPGP